ncbi:hypothetical protein H4S07_004490, partial [Coemansia furcata]
MPASKEEREYHAKLIAKIHKLEGSVPALKGEAHCTLDEEKREVLAQAEQHSADSMRDLLLAEEQYEQKQQERADELCKLKEAKQARLAEIKKVATKAMEVAIMEYEQGTAKLVEAGQAEAQAIASAAKTAEACKENARAIATAQGFSEKFWDNNKPGWEQTGANPPKVHTAAEVVSGCLQPAMDMPETLAERERQAQHTVDLRELKRHGRTMIVRQAAFFVPEKRHFKVLTDEEEEHATQAFGAPGEHIMFNGMAIIALRQGRASLFDAMFAE